MKILLLEDDNTPTIYTTALSDITSVARGFEVGADDYIKKPFDPEELVIRIKNKYLKNDILKYKNLSYNTSTKELYKDDALILLGDVLGHLFHELVVNKSKIRP